MADRDKYVYMAKLAEQAEKYDEMARSMKHIVQLKTELSVEERNLFSVAYKNLIGARRSSWRIVNTMEEKEAALVEEKEEVGATTEKIDKRKLGVIKNYRKAIENEMTDICTDVIQLLDDFLIPSSVQTENKTFFHKMKGDYYRYMAEYTPQNDEICRKSLTAYKEAIDIVFGKDGLPPTHPIRLGLILNFSVFFFEILGEKTKAIILSQDAFDEAIPLINSLSEDSYKDTTLLMQLLRDNLAVWTTDIEDDNKHQHLVASSSFSNGVPEAMVAEVQPAPEFEADPKT